MTIPESEFDQCSRGHLRNRYRSASGLHISACGICEIEVIWRECLTPEDVEVLRDAGVASSVLTRAQLKAWLLSILPEPKQ